MTYRIVADSSANVLELDDVEFGCAPLKIVTKDREYVDDAALDVETMVAEIKAGHGRSGTACPSVGEWLEAFGDADIVVGASITGTLSGSYSAAMMAKAEYESTHPERKVFILDSLSAGPEIQLILEQLRDMARAGMSAEEIQTRITVYWRHTHLLFSLESLTNLSRNGRVNPAVAAAAGLLGIRIVGRASEQGELEPMDKCRGEKKALEALWKHMEGMEYAGGRVCIAHCMNEPGARTLAEKIHKFYPQADIQIVPTRGICSFYAEKGGLMVGFEDRGAHSVIAN